MSTPDQDSGLSASELIDLERAQIGHDIHDLLLPLIFGASATLQSVPTKSTDGEVCLDQASADKIEMVKEWLQDALSLGRNMLTQIYPPELEHMPWLLAAKDAVGKVCEQSCQANWVASDDCPLCLTELEKGLATTAYRILIESVRNAVRHGSATEIVIRCNARSLVISDNGSGFDPTSVPSGHFGIRAMKGRATLVGQTLTVRSEPGGPTEVQLTLS
ncbi:sensor histidine kinase [Rhodopirellula sp. MGV]|uniref:sensor histidine kinase n=1 Tax=Rhodopirellula sp. MGV TaxID=2023130 RepID=UPI000B960FFE|nr:ATP-binding protein [Rhodopirellula sp. MGV]OYP33154.1 hypothetical protein CGZ80_18195 [Rhodopirellula sp. MGV]PNY35117.1 hypothetical protein C2E31_19625 [Rhodopirellula baltica]